MDVMSVRSIRRQTTFFVWPVNVCHLIIADSRQKTVIVAASLKRLRKESQTDHTHPYTYASWKFGEDRSTTLWDNWSPRRPIKGWQKGTSAKKLFRMLCVRKRFFVIHVKVRFRDNFSLIFCLRNNNRIVNKKFLVMIYKIYYRSLCSLWYCRYIVTLVNLCLANWNGHAQQQAIFSRRRFFVVKGWAQCLFKRKTSAITHRQEQEMKRRNIQLHHSASRARLH